MRLAGAGRARLRMAGLAPEHHLLPGIQGVFAVVVWVGPFGQISFGDRVVERRVRIAGAHRSTDSRLMLDNRAFLAAANRWCFLLRGACLRLGGTARRGLLVSAILGGLSLLVSWGERGWFLLGHCNRIQLLGGYRDRLRLLPQRRQRRRFLRAVQFFGLPCRGRGRP